MLSQTIPEGAFSPLLASLNTEAGGASLFGSVSDANPELDDFVTSLQEQGLKVGVDAQGRIHRLGKKEQNHAYLPISEKAWNDTLGGVMLYGIVAPDLLDVGARAYPNGIIDGEGYQYVPYVFDAENDPSLAYYVAYNPETKNIDWAVTPSQLDFFQEKEGYARNYAKTFNTNEYKDYELASARVGYYVAQGRLDSAVDSLAEAWSAAFKDRGWWLNTALSVSGGMMARGAGQTNRAVMRTGTDASKRGIGDVSNPNFMGPKLLPSRGFADKSIFNTFPERTTLNTSGIDEQAQFLSQNVPGLTPQQAKSILEEGFSRDSSVVLGGSRVRGDFKPASDIDVGFGNLSERQAQRVISKLNKQDGSLNLQLEELTIVPGKRTGTIDTIVSPEEFFQRSGFRAGGDKRAGEQFFPSGSITLVPSGQILILPPGVMP